MWTGHSNQRERSYIHALHDTDCLQGVITFSPRLCLQYCQPHHIDPCDHPNPGATPTVDRQFRRLRTLTMDESKRIQVHRYDGTQAVTQNRWQHASVWFPHGRKISLSVSNERQEYRVVCGGHVAGTSCVMMQINSGSIAVGLIDQRWLRSVLSGVMGSLLPVVGALQSRWPRPFLTCRRRDVRRSVCLLW